MKKLITIALVLALWVSIVGNIFGVFGEPVDIEDIFNKYNTLPKFEQYVEENIKWAYEGWYLSNKPKSPEKILKDKKGVCGDFAFLYKEYIKRVYNISVGTIAFKYYKEVNKTGLHAIGLFKYNGVYWITENTRVIKTKVPEDFTIKEFFDAYDVAWIHFKCFNKSGRFTNKVTNPKSREEIKESLKNPDRTYRLPYSQRYEEGDFRSGAEDDTKSNR